MVFLVSTSFTYKDAFLPVLEKKDQRSNVFCIKNTSIPLMYFVSDGLLNKQTKWAMKCMYSKEDETPMRELLLKDVFIPTKKSRLYI